MIAKVWRDAFVEEGNLARHLSTLRKVLGDNGLTRRYVVTVQGRGYRFIAPVSRLDTAGPGVRGDAAAAASLFAPPVALEGKATEAVKWLLETAAAGYPDYPLFTRDRRLDRIRGSAPFALFMAQLEARWRADRLEFGD